MDAHDTAIAQAARAEVARRSAQFSAWPGMPRPPLIASAPPTVAVERLVWQLLRWPLLPLRLLSGALSRAARRR